MRSDGSTPAVRPRVLVVASGIDPAEVVLESWRAALPDGPVDVVHGADALRGRLGSEVPDRWVVVTGADVVPGPALVERLLGGLGGEVEADLVDARVLPVDLAAAVEQDMEAEEAAVEAGRVGPRVSGACVLVRAGAATDLADQLARPRDPSSGAALVAALDAAGLRHVVAVAATVVRLGALPGEVPGDERRDEPGHRPAAVPGVPPVTKHPGAMEATALHHLLRAAGMVGWLPEEEEADRPFLTVLTRTQGRRRRCLEDVMACVAAQADQDLEWLVVCHRSDPAELAVVREVLALAPSHLAGRIRVLEVDRPGRAAPLNDGFAAARGRYVAILDDDDTVAADWVAAFRRLEQGHAGQLLRTCAARQSVVPQVVDGETVAVTVGNPRRDWPARFDLLDHLQHNQTPLMSVAFPRAVVTTLGIRFDEDLDITEDWDFLVRAAGVLGVADAPDLTSVYRWWLTDETSRVVHDEGDWEAARRRVLDRFAASYVLLPGDGARPLQAALADAQRRIVELETSQHEVIMQLDHTASEHQKTVDNWRASEARVAELKERLDTSRGRFKRRIALLEAVEDRLRETGAPRPSESIYAMAPRELQALLDSLPDGPPPRPRFGRSR